jgi:hypothetical protein
MDKPKGSISVSKHFSNALSTTVLISGHSGYSWRNSGTTLVIMPLCNTHRLRFCMVINQITSALTRTKFVSFLILISGFTRDNLLTLLFSNASWMIAINYDYLKLMCYKLGWLLWSPVWTLMPLRSAAVYSSRMERRRCGITCSWRPAVDEKRLMWNNSTNLATKIITQNWILFKIVHKRLLKYIALEKNAPKINYPQQNILKTYLK